MADFLYDIFVGTMIFLFGMFLINNYNSIQNINNINFNDAISQNFINKSIIYNKNDDRFEYIYYFNNLSESDCNTINNYNNKRILCDEENNNIILEIIFL